MKKSPLKKKKSLSKLKHELDAVFSKYIRQKYAKNGQVQCYTCGTSKEIREIQCGHFVSRQHLSTRFDEENVRPQCAGCNLFGGGRVATFANNLENETRGIVVALYRKGNEITKWYTKDYEEKIQYYQEALDKLYESKGYVS